MKTPGPQDESVGALSGRKRAGIAILCVGFGSFICAAAMRWVALPPAPGVPYWLAGLAGVVFVLAGVAVALPQRASRLQDLIGALLFTAFAAMALWIGFGPGQRAFSGGVSVGPVGFGTGQGETIGRIAFGAMGIVVSLIAIKSWLRLARPSASEDSTGNHDGHG